jgi:hypothetical protein
MKKKSEAVLHIRTAKEVKKVATLGKRVTTGMGDNPTVFTEPDPNLVTIDAETNALNGLIAEAESGDRATIEARNAKAETVYDLLKSEIAYVNKVANGDRAIILLSGFDANDEAAPVPAPGKVIVRRVDFGPESHSAKVIIEPLADARYYKIETTTTPTDESSYKVAVDNVSSRDLVIRNLTRGQEIWIRVAGGNAHGWGYWSEPIAFIAM